MTDLHFAIGLLFGHTFGDYAFQNNWMALSKSKNAFRCFVHCLIYTATVMLFTWTFTWWWAALVFLSHYFIDQFSLGDKWLRLVRGRSLKCFMEAHDLDYSNSIIEALQNTKHQQLRAGCTTFVYIVVDNTVHLAIMWYGYNLLEKIV